jgi:hypothetical protein
MTFASINSSTGTWPHAFWQLMFARLQQLKDLMFVSGRCCEVNSLRSITIELEAVNHSRFGQATAVAQTSWDFAFGGFFEFSFIGWSICFDGKTQTCSICP